MRERRFKKKRMPRKVYLVICEGETEKVYVEALRRHYRTPVTIKTKVSGNSINKRLVEQYINELGIGSLDDCSVFYIYDADIECVADKLHTLPGTVILTNPCLELWYVLHTIEHRRQTKSEEIIKILKDSHSVWRGYIKGRLTSEQSTLLTANCRDAINRAKNLDWPKNPSSNLMLFIEALENAGNG